MLAIRYAPTAGALAAAQETAARVEPATLLAVDNPDGSLVFAAHEVDAVLSYFAAGQAAALRGPAATRRAVLARLPHSAVYHLATHGWAGWDEPLEGGLLMAGAEPLTVRDLLDLRLARGAAGGALGLRDRHPRHQAA